MPSERLPERRRTRDAYGTIREQILQGERAAGQWLREGEIAEALGISRTPVREALRRLAAEGLVRHEPNRGVRVERWSLADVAEIFSLRSVLEPWACALAASSGLADLDELQALADAMDAAVEPQPDLDEITRLNNEFHRAIIRAAGHSRLEQLIATVVEVPLVWRTFSYYSPAEMRRSLAHHHELIAALRAGDPSWAESVMRAHVRAAHAALRAYGTDVSANRTAD